jgi:hypothetical protein
MQLIKQVISNNELNRVEKERNVVRGSSTFTENIRTSKNRQMLSGVVDHHAEASCLEALPRKKVEKYLLFSIETRSRTISIIDEQLVLSLKTLVRSEKSKLSSGLQCLKFKWLKISCIIMT